MRESSNDRAGRPAEDREQERRRRAENANPDVPSPESGDTSEDQSTGGGGSP